MDLDSLIIQFKDLERAGISDMDTLMTGMPFLARESYKLLEKVRKFEKRFPQDGSESEYDILKNEIKDKERELANLRTRHKDESIKLRKEMGRAGKMIEDVKNQLENEKKRADKYKIALTQTEMHIEDLKKATSSEEDRKEIRRLQAELFQKETEINEFKTDNTVSKLNNEINILQKGLVRAELELNEFKNESDHEKNNLKRRMEEALQDASISKNALYEAKSTIQDLKKRASNDLLKREIERLKEQLESKKSKSETAIFSNNFDSDTENLKRKIELKNSTIEKLEDEKNADRKIYKDKIEEAYNEIKRLKTHLQNGQSENPKTERLKGEVNFLKDELEKKNTIISNLKKFKPPSKKQGTSGDAGWAIEYNEESNRLFINFNGKFTYNDAKKATRNIESVLLNVIGNFDVICDFTNLKNKFEKKTAFQLRKIIFMMQTAKVNRLFRIVPSEKRDFGDLLQNVSRKNRFEVIELESIDELENY